MSRSIPLLTTVMGSALLFAGETQSVFAQWDPWLLGPRYQTSYYGGSSFYGGYWTGYAPAPAYNNCCYGPAPACDCGCPSACGGCASGNCASGNCSLNAAPPGSPKPIADPELDRRVPGRTNPGGRGTFDPNDNRNFEDPSRSGTGTGGGLDDAPPPKFRSGTGSGTGTGTNNADDDGFRPRGRTGTGTGTGNELEKNPDPFKANKPETSDPDLPNVPDRVPAAPANVKEEAPLDADLGLEAKMTNRPVLMRERQAMKSRFTTPSLARTPAPAKINWSATPVSTRVARQ